MITYECKACGGELENISPGLGKCTYCGKVGSMPTIDSELMVRANRIRQNNLDFDESAILYKKVIEQCPDESEAYWGLVLCKFGIKYEEEGDKLIPTCNRTIEKSILEDADYQLACEKAGDETVKKHYIDQAKIIDNIQKKILEIVYKEKPYQVFICYKKKKFNSNEDTIDCREAMRLYHKLEKKGFKVFFAEETLGKKAGEEYEPYIYAALKTSKVLVVFGSSEEYIDAPWVKNEWKRFIHMMETDKNKVMIPILLDGLEPEYLPKEMQKFQAINWRDPEAMEKIFSAIEEHVDKVSSNYRRRNNVDDVSIDAKIENAHIYLETQNFNELDKLITEILRDDPNNSEGHWLKLLCRQRVPNYKGLEMDISKDPDFIIAMKNATEEQKKYYEECRDYLIDKLFRMNNKDKENQYHNQALKLYTRNSVSEEIYNGEIGEKISQMNDCAKEHNDCMSDSKLKGIISAVKICLILGFVVAVPFPVGCSILGMIVFLILALLFDKRNFWGVGLSGLFIWFSIIMMDTINIEMDMVELTFTKLTSAFFGIIMLLAGLAKSKSCKKNLKKKKILKNTYMDAHNELKILLEQKFNTYVEENDRLYREYKAKLPEDYGLVKFDKSEDIRNQYNQFCEKAASHTLI